MLEGLNPLSSGLSVIIYLCELVGRKLRRSCDDGSNCMRMSAINLCCICRFFLMMHKKNYLILLDSLAYEDLLLNFRE